MDKRKRIKMVSMICPYCGGREFVTSAHVVQRWRVSYGGDFLEEVESCTEVLHGPDADNIWSCYRCGKEAVSLDDFSLDHDPNDLVYEIEADEDFYINGKSIGKKFFLALYDSCAETTEGLLSVGYSIYDSERKLFDGGNYDYPIEIATETVADRLEEVLDFIFVTEEFLSKEKTGEINISVSDLDRCEDFED